MRPLFEAISNAIHSTQHAFQDKVSELGRVMVEIATDRRKENVWAVVEDNGLGLDATNWEAFTTTDTDNKIQIGGKGVGRLLWLDCFKNVEVQSVFTTDAGKMRRSFRFVLSVDNQIQYHKLEEVPPTTPSGFYVKFSGLKNNGYLAKFPGRDSFIFQHLSVCPGTS